MRNKTKNFLRIVWDKALSGSKDKISARKTSLYIQTDMFFSNDANSISVIFFSDINGDEFAEALKAVHPKFVIDMRPNPRFDSPGYSRKMAFTDFNELGTTYLDYLELLGGNDKDKEHLLSAAMEVICKTKDGPLAILFDNKELDEAYEEDLIQRLSHEQRNWDLSVIPSK